MYKIKQQQFEIFNYIGGTMNRRRHRRTIYLQIQ